MDGGLRPVFQSLVGRVVASIGGPHDVQLVRRVVQPETVAHLLVHHLFFVKGCDEECHVRQSLVRGELSPDRFHKEFLQFDQHVKQYSVSQVGIEYEEEGEPEKDFEPGGNCVVHNRLESLSL